MNKAERVLVFGGLTAALALAVGTRLPDTTPLARADAPHYQPASGVATLDTFEVMTRTFQSKTYQAPREARVAELNAILQPLRTELEELSKKFEALPENSPERTPLMTTGQAKNQELQTKQQELAGQMDAFVGEQIREVYALVARTAQSVAAAKGLGVVISSASVDAFKVENVNEALQEVLRRPVLHGGTDITADVLKELQLDAPAATPAPTPPPAP